MSLYRDFSSVGVKIDHFEFYTKGHLYIRRCLVTIHAQHMHILLPIFVIQIVHAYFYEGSRIMCAIDRVLEVLELSITRS